MTIDEGNKLIAEFYGLTFNGHHWELPMPTRNKIFKTLEYHHNWNRLMEVLEKICRMKVGDGITTTEYANPRTFGMLSEQTGNIMVRLNGFQCMDAHTLIEATWLSVIDFIQWYNSQNK